MLAQSHRHYEIVKFLQNEIKKKSRWFPPLGEIWGWIFGAGAEASKGPLILFFVSVLLWNYPMYIIQCIPITWNTLRRTVIWQYFHSCCSLLMNNDSISALHFHLLEHRDVGQLDYRE